MLYTNPLYVHTITEDDRYVVVKTDSEHTLRYKKTLGRTLQGLEEDQVYRFGAFEPWNPYEWFVEFKPVEWKERTLQVHHKKGNRIAGLVAKAAIKFWTKEEGMNKLDTDESIIVSYIPMPTKSVSMAFYHKVKKGKWTYRYATNKSYIAINHDLELYTMINALFHELTHLRQTVTGQLEDNKWYGVVYDKDIVSYRDLPWEIDAFARADELTKKFIIEMDVKEIAANYY